MRPLRDRVMVKILLLVILVTMLLVTGCVQPATEVEELNRLRSQLADSQAELAEKPERIEELQAKIAELEANLSQLAGPQAELAEKSKRIEELKAKLAGLEATITGSAPIHNGLFYDLHHINMVKSNRHVEPWASAYRNLRYKAEKSMWVKPEPIREHWHVPWKDKDLRGRRYDNYCVSFTHFQCVTLNRWRLRSPEKKLALVASAIFYLRR